jgi:tellurite resistance protein
VLLTAYIRGNHADATTVAADLSDPIAGPFFSLVVLTPLLAAANGLYPISHTAGTVVVDIGLVAVVVLAGWLTGEWIYTKIEVAKLHPGYFLPSVAGGFVASIAAAQVGQMHIAELLFGIGLICWIVLGSVVLGRLILGPPLPTPLAPTLAIEVAPAAVATFAAFSTFGPHVDTMVRIISGYGLLMVVAQIRLLVIYRRLSFMPSFWAFTFSWAAVGFATLAWLGITHTAGWRVFSYLVLAAVTILIAAIAARTIVAIRAGRLLPAVQPAPVSTAPATAAPASAASVPAD